jgi:hypothetical protein
MQETSALVKPPAAIEPTTMLVKRYVTDVTSRASRRATQLKASALQTASDPHVQVTAAAAVAGGASLGTAGGAVGATLGGVVGAAVGVVPALFTFGLSIPVFGAVGAAVGGGAGATVGGTTGLVGGGAAGYYGYAHKDEIRQGAISAYDRVNACQAYATGKLTDSASFLSCKVRQLQPAKRSLKAAA